MQTELDSFLIEISALIFGKADDKEGKDGWLLDKILDKTGMKGTGAAYKGPLRSASPAQVTRPSVRFDVLLVCSMRLACGLVCCQRRCSGCKQGMALSLYALPALRQLHRSNSLQGMAHQGPHCSVSLQTTSSLCPG